LTIDPTLLSPVSALYFRKPINIGAVLKIIGAGIGERGWISTVPERRRYRCRRAES